MPSIIARNYKGLLFTSLVVMAGIPAEIKAQDAASSTAYSPDAAMAAEVQNSADTGANELAAHLLHNGRYRTVIVPGNDTHASVAGIEVRPSSSNKTLNSGSTAMKTQFRVFIPSTGLGSLKPLTRDEVMRAQSTSKPPEAGQVWNTPASIACVYDLVTQPTNAVAGCIPDSSVTNPSGGGGAIAIVDAYDTPATVADLARFSQQFGLPSAQYKIVYASGRRPQSSYTAADQGWDIESELDVQWAHAMAPAAKIFLVEAASDSNADLFAAVDVATNLVEQNGGGQVSMSWGESENASETTDDTHFREKPGVLYTTGAGDTNIVSYPAASPHVIAVGGTSLTRNTQNVIEGEVVWNDPSEDEGTGGGLSQYEARPTFQSAVSSIVGSTRGTPDVSFDADTASGVWVMAYGYWYIIGGTSVGAPSIAGIINVANTQAKTLKTNTSQAELSGIYKTLANKPATVDFRDIVSGSCGSQLFALAGYDLCSGLGSPGGYLGYGATNATASATIGAPVSGPTPPGFELVSPPPWQPVVFSSH